MTQESDSKAIKDPLQHRYAGAVELGRTPALVLVDFTAEFVEAEEMSADLSCNPRSAIERANTLLDHARSAAVPVVWTRNSVESEHGRESWAWTHGPNHREHPRAGEITGFNVWASEFVLTKTKPSAFFASPLLSFLIARQVDTLLICGGTTSGCVRATVVDGFSYNYRVGLARDACFDRDQQSHDVSLKDVGAKYCRVSSVEELGDYLRKRAPTSSEAVIGSRSSQL